MHLLHGFGDLQAKKRMEANLSCSEISEDLSRYEFVDRFKILNTIYNNLSKRSPDDVVDDDVDNGDEGGRG